VAAIWSAAALAVQLLLAAGLAAALAAAGVSGPALAAWVSLELCAVALLLAAAPLALALCKASGPARRLHAGRRALAICGDALAFEAALVRMALEPWRAPPESPAVTTPTPIRPLLLIHGFACSRAVWRPLLARLRAAGVGPTRAVSLEPLHAGIETHVGQVVRVLEALAADGGGRAVTVVTHSMGGLVARAALRRARPGLIGRIITLGAPHHGTALACWFPWPGVRQMRPGATWLEELNASQEGRLGIPVTTLYSLDDNYIVPAASARLEGARAFEFRGLGHLSLLVSRRVLRQVMSEVLA
jgi:triacylglycerol esterase/lipase EstA (alpha/beta hydrolase family)